MSRGCLSLLLILLLPSCQAQPPADITDPGQLLFLGYVNDDVNCSRCHGQDGQGGQDAPALTDIFKKHDQQKVREIILDGKGLGKKSMPAFAEKLKPEELEALMRFLNVAFTAEEN
ncbi:MAG TPA: cytochrome c [bacterium]